jgi:hypothetical protein
MTKRITIEDYNRDHSCIDFNLEKRDKIDKGINEMLFGYEFDRDKLSFGELTFTSDTAYFLAKFGYEDNIYYMFYRPLLGGPMIVSKNNNAVPREAAEYGYNELYPKLLPELSKLAQKGLKEGESK